jgi:ArsR family transcriptional regulator
MNSLMQPRPCKEKSLPADFSQALEFLKTLGEENRLKILSLLKEGEKCVCEIGKALKLPQNLTSHHLKVLKDFGLIFSEKRGLKVFYKLNQKAVEEQLEALDKFLRKEEK